MLSYALAIAVAISSLVLFFTAFLMSHIHRRDDFFWSGIGLFYALVLWYCAKNITGAVLLGQTAATALLVSYSWQTIKLRRAIANPAKAAEINNFSILRSLNNLVKSKKPQVKVPTSPVEAPTKSKVTEQEIAIPDTPSKEKSVDTSVGNSESKQPREKIVKTPTPISQPVVEPTNSSQEDRLKAQSSLKTKPQESSTPKPTEANSVPTTPTNVVAEQPETLTNVRDSQPPSNKPEKSSRIDSDETTEAKVVTSETEPVSKTETSKTPKEVSPMDTLETVEVAEVLEAIPDDGTTNRDSNPDNIIEVTTTEIKVTKEVKVEQDWQDDLEDD